MILAESIREEHAPIIVLQVYHRRLRIPIDIYLKVAEKFTDPWQEQAYQFFIQTYFEEIRDEGIVGMVRQNKDTDYVYLDAAVRYPVATDDKDYDSILYGCPRRAERDESYGSFLS